TAQSVQRPALTATPRFAMTPIQQLTLSNGVPVLLVEKPGIPIVQVNLVVKAGSVDDPAGKTGLAALTAQLLDEGAGQRSALELADAVDFLGIDLTTFAGLHTMGVDLHTPTSKLADALDLMADVTLRPAFPADEVERAEAQTAVGLAQRRDQPTALATALLNRTLFGEAHPYGRSAMPVTVRAITRDDLVAFHRARFATGNAAFVVVGDVTAASLLPVLEARFGAAAWPASAGTASATVAPTRQVAGRTIAFVDKPGAAQSVIRIGRIGAARSTDDYYALQVLNAILGGSFTSRLNQNLRETHGYAYGAGSSFVFRPVPGPFLAASNVQTDATAPALTEFVKELTNIRTIPQDEVDKGKNFVALSFPETFQTVEGTADMVADLWANNLPLDTYNRYTDRVMAVSRADLERAARTYIDPAKVAIVVVGDKASQEAAVRALRLGPVTSLTVNDVFPEQ
ncbi:MAG: insulinase family protein, partial [Rhodothermales bacterium]|nr:insulinase family protein [Rhodothermales bacterium]